jgi:hypothetical protein
MLKEIELLRSSSTRGNSNRDYTENRTAPQELLETLTDYTENRTAPQEKQLHKKTLTEITLKTELLHREDKRKF